MIFWILVFVITFLLFKFYYHIKFSYWSKQNIPGPKPLPFLGTALDLITNVPSELDHKLSKKYGSIWGEYLGHQTNLVIGDAKHVKQILITDFNIFNQGQKPLSSDSIFSKMLTTLHGEQWKKVRSPVSGIFSASKQRRVLQHMERPIQNTIDNLEKLIAEGKDDKIQVKTLLKGYALDVIAKFVFAIEVNSYKQKDDQFVRKVLEFTNFRIWVFLAIQILPKKFTPYLARQIVSPNSALYMIELSKEIIKKRRSNPDVKYQDFVELMIQSNQDLEEEEIIGQLLIFFFAGMDTVSTTLSIVLSDLAIHQEHQERIVEEIDRVIGDNPITYENIKELEFLDAFFCESTRRTPIANRIIRYAQADYNLPGTDILIKKGQQVMLSISKVHHDPEVYPEPFEFRPERFLGENKKELKQNHWMPFSMGPRHCVAMRFAIMEVKYYLINVLKRYHIRLADGVRTPIEYRKGSFVVLQKDLRLKFAHRNK